MQRNRGADIRCDSQHVQGNEERALCNLAVGILSIRLGHIAAISKVPCCRGRVSRITVVGAHLAVDAHGVEDKERQAAQSGQERVPDSHDNRNELGEQEEERDDGDGDIEISESDMPLLVKEFPLSKCES